MLKPGDAGAPWFCAWAGAMNEVPRLKASARIDTDVISLPMSKGVILVASHEPYVYAPIPPSAMYLISR